MEQAGEMNMSVRTKSPLFPGLASVSAAAASKEVGQASAIDTMEAETLDKEKTCAAVTEQAKRISGSVIKTGSGGGSDNIMTAGTSFHTTAPPNKPRDESEMSPDSRVGSPHRYVPQITREKPSPNCIYLRHHLIGRFCFYCRGMEMPWGDFHPTAFDTNGKKIRIAPHGALLEGVKNLTEPYEITQLALLIEFRTQLQSPTTIHGLVEALSYFPDLHDVARRIADLTQELATLADESERARVPHWSNILHDLLIEPTLTREQYFARATREWNLQPVNGGMARVKAPNPIIPSFPLSTRGHTGALVTLTREDAIEDAAKTHSKVEVDELIKYLDRNESRGPGYVQFTLDFVNWLREGAHGTGRGAPQWGPHYVQQYHSVTAASADSLSHQITRSRKIKLLLPRRSGQLKFFDTRKSASNTTPNCSDENSDTEVHDSNDEENFREPSFRKLPEVKKNTPGRSGVDWQFVEGSDLENAELGKPDPSKFYLTRVNMNNPTEIDVRQYTHIAMFDWNNPQDISKLNKARAQNRKRVNGNIAETRIPWTQMEKACLFEEVQEAINAGQNRQTIDWDDIAARLKTRFEGVLQEKGAKLAPGVEREPKDGKDKTLRTSRSDRIGYNRTGSATETQALKYPDILQMINNATGIGGKGGRGLLRGPRRNLSKMNNGAQDEGNNQPTKKIKTIPRSFSTSPTPDQSKENYKDDNDDENDGSHMSNVGHPAVRAAFDMKFTKSNANYFDTNPGNN
ncbi:hypothetical protein NHQ30_007865 [Ciborinia camelliae]|nr:hypothetical protein NHQ30_007865 [Ciborinia camelliae]